MVVLEDGGMLTNGHNQYLQPDYLPHTTTLDAKKSPLALLAQTCSQIGADSPTKPLISPLEKSSKSGASARSPPAAKSERTRSSPSEPKPLAFKPYETNVVTKKSSEDGRPTSKASVHSASGQDSVSASENNNVEKKSGNRTPIGRKSASPSQGLNSSPSNRSPSDERKSPAHQDRDKTNNSPHTSGASPIIRSGMEVLGSAHHKDAMFKHGAGLAAFAGNPLCCPPGLTENPAFRPPFAGASPFSHHHAVAAAALLGYPTAAATASNPYMSYTRVKTASGGDALMPVCKDPYCTGCQYSMHNAQMMMGGGACPSGCTQCEHQKYGLAMALSSLSPMPPPSLSYAPQLAGGRSNMCSWASADQATCCGKRFSTSEEFLQHVRTHTNISGEHAALLAGPHPHPLLSPTAALHRAATSGNYPAPPLSPLGARYHPYGKPPTGTLSASLGASPYSAFNTLGPYYSPYAIYGQRMGAAHP